MKKQYVKTAAIVFLGYVILSVLIAIFTPIVPARCSRNNLPCNVIQGAVSVVYFPAAVIQRFTIVKFTWSDGNKGIRVGNTVYGGLKVGNWVVIKTRESFVNF